MLKEFKKYKTYNEPIIPLFCDHQIKEVPVMTLSMITEGLLALLKQNHYNISTIRFYEREWSKIRRFLIGNYGNEEFDMERGLAYLEKQYSFVTKYNDGTLSQQRVQLLRVVHMLEDYRLHQVLTRRCHATRNPVKLNDYYSTIHDGYLKYLDNSGLAKSTLKHYQRISLDFLDYLAQKDVPAITDVDINLCNGYLTTMAGLSFKTVEQNVCGLRHFLRYLQESNVYENGIADKIHMPPISKKAQVPSAWKAEELQLLLAAIDRNSPIGKRDYAMIVLACVLGLRISDIKALRFSNFDWNTKTLSIVQQKTKKPLTLPLPDQIGWAVIDYIRDGRPKYDGTDVVFLKHMPPFDALSDNDHLEQRIIYHMNKAGIRRDKNRHSGFHSLRHSAASMLLEMETPLPVITTVLGQTDTDVTAIYLKTDIRKLAECVLSPEDLEDE